MAIAAPYQAQASPDQGMRRRVETYQVHQPHGKCRPTPPATGAGGAGVTTRVAVGGGTSGALAAAREALPRPDTGRSASCDLVLWISKRVEPPDGGWAEASVTDIGSTAVPNTNRCVR